METDHNDPARPPARVREVFDDWARRGRAEGMEADHAPTARCAFARLALGPVDWFLDIGCGNGYAVRWAAEAAPEGRAFGIDLAPEMIAHATSRAEDLANATFITGSILEVALPERGFDAVFSMEAFYYIDDLDGALRRVHSVVRPGGRFACALNYYTENPASHAWPTDVGIGMNLLGETEWRDAFARAGFRDIEQERLTLPASETGDRWRIDAGTLLTVGMR